MNEENKEAQDQKNEVPQQVVETPRMVVQSYILTTARRDWGLYGEKLLLKLVEMAQSEVEGMSFKGGKDLCKHDPKLDFVRINESGDAIVSIPIKSLLPQDINYTNYEFVRDSVQKMQRQIIEWQDGNDWVSCQIIGKAKGSLVPDASGLITIKVDTDIWKAMVDFTKGFRAFDLSIALKLKSKYSLRLYQLMSRQKTPLTRTVADLKLEWGISDKYARTDDFIKNTIGPAKEELDKISPYSFTYTCNKASTAGKGQKPVESITFMPVYQVKFEKAGSANFDRTMMIDSNVKAYLRNKFSFMPFELSHVYEILHMAGKTMTGADKEHPTLIDFLSKIAPKALAKGKGAKGYVINSIKYHLEERYNITFEKSKQANNQKANAQLRALNEKIVRNRERNSEILESGERKEGKSQPLKTIGDIFAENGLNLLDND